MSDSMIVECAKKFDNSNSYTACTEFVHALELGGIDIKDDDKEGGDVLFYKLSNIAHEITYIARIGLSISINGSDVQECAERFYRSYNGKFINCDGDFFNVLAARGAFEHSLSCVGVIHGYDAFWLAHDISGISEIGLKVSGKR